MSPVQQAGIFFGGGALLGTGIAVYAALRDDYLLAGAAVIGGLLCAHLVFKAIRLARAGVYVDHVPPPWKRRAGRRRRG